MHLAHDSERRLLAQIHDVGEGVLDGRPVIEHQEQTGNRLHQEEEERRSPHAPRVAHARARAAHLNRMQVKDERAQNGQDPLAIRVGDAHPEDGFPDLGIDDAVLQCSQVRHVSRSLTI